MAKYCPIVAKAKYFSPGSLSKTKQECPQFHSLDCSDDFCPITIQAKKTQEQEKIMGKKPCILMTVVKDFGVSIPKSVEKCTYYNSHNDCTHPDCPILNEKKNQD